METIYLSQHNSTTYSNGVADDNVLQSGTVQNPFVGSNGILATSITPQPRIFKTIVDVVGEGLKQNFLGPNIDIEFLTLTVRSFALSSAKAIQQLVKPNAKKQAMENPCHQLNQPCF